MWMTYAFICLSLNVIFCFFDSPPSSNGQAILETIHNVQLAIFGHALISLTLQREIKMEKSVLH